jgi:predicted deacetylase
MEVVHAERLSTVSRRTSDWPRALISLHDVSPLTLGDCRTALQMFGELGLSLSDLTCFVIPFHEGQRAIDQDAETLAFLRELADGGATLVMHGLTHRMSGRAWTPAGWFRAHVFARGQGEFFRSDAADAERRLDQAREIFRRAGLESALRGFIPPAWLLSRAAREVVDRAGFEFYELFDGIVYRGRRLCPRVIGWGSLSEIEARATALYASVQSFLPPADTRLAVHPADMARASQRRAVRRVVARVLRRLRPVSYGAYLAAH